MPIPYVYRHIPAYTKCDVQLIKVAPDDGLIQSKTCRASNEKTKFNHRNLSILFVCMHIVESCIYKSHNVTSKYTLHFCMAYPFSVFTYGF